MDARSPTSADGVVLSVPTARAPSYIGFLTAIPLVACPWTLEACPEGGSVLDGRTAGGWPLD